MLVIVVHDQISEVSNDQKRLASYCKALIDENKRYRSMLKAPPHEQANENSAIKAPQDVGVAAPETQDAKVEERSVSGVPSGSSMGMVGKDVSAQVEIPSLREVSAERAREKSEVALKQAIDSKLAAEKALSKATDIAEKALLRASQAEKRLESTKTRLEKVEENVVGVEKQVKEFTAQTKLVKKMQTEIVKLRQQLEGKIEQYDIRESHYKATTRALELERDLLQSKFEKSEGLLIQERGMIEFLARTSLLQFMLCCRHAVTHTKVGCLDKVNKLLSHIELFNVTENNLTRKLIEEMEKSHGLEEKARKEHEQAQRKIHGLEVENGALRVRLHLSTLLSPPKLETPVDNRIVLAREASPLQNRPSIDDAFSVARDCGVD
jgi:myosin heavy subunit